MNHRLYVVHDRLAETNSPVCQQPTDAAAIRMFQQIMAKEPVSSDDYALLYIGTLNTITCEINPCYPPQEIVVYERTQTVPQNGQQSSQT